MQPGSCGTGWNRYQCRKFNEQGAFKPKTYIGLVNKHGRKWQKQKPNPTKMQAFKSTYVRLTAYLRSNTMTKQLHCNKKDKKRNNHKNNKKLSWKQRLSPPSASQKSTCGTFCRNPLQKFFFHGIVSVDSYTHFEVV
jgi:hypothetical protein